jgi:hypothetical protein
MPDGGVTIRASILSGLWLCLADLISPPKVSLLDGCPMFAPAYMGRKRIFQMLSLQVRGSLLLAAVFVLASQDRWKGLRPVFFGPCTLGRTWGTRPGGWASFFALSATLPMDYIWIRCALCPYN